MLVLDGTVVYSASDLAAAARCEYALLRAFDARLGRGPEVAAGTDRSPAPRDAGTERSPAPRDSVTSTSSATETHCAPDSV